MRGFTSARAIAVGALVLGACQSILGFEEFEATAPGSAGSGGSGGKGGTGGKGGGSTGGKAGASSGGSTSGGSSGGAGEGGAGGGAVGEACGENGPCAGGLVCLYGFCRPECGDDTDCAQDSVCLFRTATGGGCRLAAETCDPDCANADLVCGIDDTCRIACSAENSCDSSTQRCIAGTCVSTVGQSAEEWDCGSLADGEIDCDGARLVVCNVIEPGLGTIVTCPSADICDASFAAGDTYDPDNPPECAPGCVATERYCNGATLLVCNETGTGPLPGGHECATPALCDQSVEDASDTCVEPACDEGDVRCSGGQGDLSVQACNDERTAFEDEAFCDAAQQCNPGASTCFTLDIDPTEVSMHEYAEWVGSNPAPSTAGQVDACSWNTSYALDQDCVNAGIINAVVGCQGSMCNAPVVCVDWCDAFAYCEAQGRRLCGRFGGGMTPYDRATDPGQSQWMNGCTAGGQYEWSGGSSPMQSDGEPCWYAGLSTGAPYAVGTHSACQSPSPNYGSLSDFSGNVEEWEDSCERTATTGDASDACNTRGGSVASDTPADIRCDALPSIPHARNDVSPTLGFRCCGT